MIELTLELSQVDFDAALELLLPQLTEHLIAAGNPMGRMLSNPMTAELAKTMLHSLDQSRKEQLFVSLVNRNQQGIHRALETIAENMGIHARVTGASAQIK